MFDLEYSRRDALRIGGISLGLASLGLSDIGLAEEKSNNTEKSVIWVWLSGGPSHIELFNPIPDAPAEYTSVTGSVATKMAGIRFGGQFTKLAQIADKLSVVRSFTHGNSDHDRATHYVMTGYNQRSGAEQTHPALGSIISRVYGPSSPATGLPLYTSDGNINHAKASWLGGAYNPFDVNSDAKKNFMPMVEAIRLHERASVLTAMDRFQKDSEYIRNLDKIKQQAYDIILGKARQAFEIKQEPQKIQDAYGTGLGERLLLARRLVQYGSRFVTVNYGGWDTHQNMKPAFDKMCPTLDNSLAALILDLEQQGMTKNTLVVVTGEFGRTPKVNKDAGRDHWGQLGTLVFAGGKYEMGRVIGTSDDKATTPETNPIKPLDIVATLFDHFEINPTLKYKDHAGRPHFLLDGPGKIIL